jgi:hypothetical protein
VLPKYKAAARLQQLPYLPHYTLHIPHRTQNLNTQYGIHTPLCNPFASQDLAFFNTTRQELVLVLEVKFLNLCGDLISIVRVGVNGVYEVYERWIVAVDLVARPRTELKDFASSRGNERGNTGGVFIGNKAVRYV